MLTKIQKFATTNGYSFEMDDIAITLTINDSLYFIVYSMDNEIMVSTHDASLIKSYPYPDTFKTQKQAVNFLESYIEKAL